MEESPSKKPTSSKVIDSLQKQIDELKEELETTKISNSNYKKKYEIVSQKNDLFVDQLANSKHENDMINALLKRKERRILDLESEYNNLISSNENLKMTNKNMKIRYDSLQELSASSTAECERLKIAYDALTASQVEYKKHYELEIQKLNEEFKKFKSHFTTKYEDLLLKFNNNDKDIDSLLDGLTNKRKTLDSLYFNKNKLILDLLSKLALVAKTHGQDTKQILHDNLDNLIQLREKYPDLEVKINEKNLQDNENSLSSIKDGESQQLTESALKEINLEGLISEGNEALNTSFDEEATLIDEPRLSRQNTLKKNNTNNKKKRYSKYDDNKLERTRTPTPPTNSHTDRNKNKGKRRSMYGNNYNSNPNGSNTHSHSYSYSQSYSQSQSHGGNNTQGFNKNIPINS